MNQELQHPEPPTQRPRPVRRAATPRPQHAVTAEVYPEEEDGFFVRHRVQLVMAGVLALGLGVYLLPKPKPSAPARPAERIVQVQLPPPPPPKVQPPPPPKVQPREEKMDKETQPTEAKPQEAAPKKSEAPPPTALATNNRGPGPGMSGLSGSGLGLGGGNAIGGTTGGAAGGSKWGWYAGQVQTKITAALRQHPKTKTASISSLEVRIWPDASGRVARVKIIGSTGNAALDLVLEREVLTGLQLQEPPPAGMKLPINLRISARRQG